MPSRASATPCSSAATPPLAAARGLRVVMEVQAPLVRLLRGLPGVDAVVARGEALPAFDLHCPMLSLPLALGTTLDDHSRRRSYLHADPAQVAAWRTRLAAMASQGRRIGLVWAGNPRHSPRRQSTAGARCAPERLAPLVRAARACSSSACRRTAPRRRRTSR